MISLIVLSSAILLIFGYISVIFFKKIAWMIVPIIFILSFLTLMKVPDFTGYAVDSSFVGSENLAVLAVLPSSEKFFILVKPVGTDQEPRLVSIAVTDDNKQKLQDLQKNYSKQAMVINFGNKHKSKSHGNEGDGIQDNNDDFDVMNFADPQVMSKS